MQTNLYAATPGKRVSRSTAHQTAAERANAATNPYVGRRVARRAVDAPSSTVAALPLIAAAPSLIGTPHGVLTLDRPAVRHGSSCPAPGSTQAAGTAPVALSRTAGRPDLLDTGTINQVLAGLQPVDHSTSFADEVTEAMPLLVVAPGIAGKRRAVKHAGRRGPLFRGLPSASLLLGITALAISAGGALTLGGSPDLASSQRTGVTQASALTGVGGIGSVGTQRSGTPISRDSARDSLAQGAAEAVADPVEEKAAARSGSIRALANQAEDFSAVIERNQWQLPMDSYRLTATYGQYGLWSSYHTGLDFAGPTGTPINAVANGVVTSAGYDGSYGNKTVVTLDDGTEIWYCHQNSFGVSVGDTVRSGELLGYVGSTGNVTGPHLHLEVRPGGGDPVDPYAALVENGIQP
ncbi:MAG: peptidoglycan DD-metalloendopeptidase family protein [Nocardioides sp.]|nr:peptidoglycan DD-metalloendopeptidase family protein [Nocardioides sp.]